MWRIIAQITAPMMPRVFHIILLQPQIPQNAGNIIRLCANTGCALHLVKPCTFDLSHKGVRRAGLDYAELAEVSVHESLALCLAQLRSARLFSVETSGTHLYSDRRFRGGDAFVFGPETRGVPEEVIAEIAHERRLRIPMRSGSRSLNLANAVALVVYEAWRQNGFI